MVRRRDEDIKESLRLLQKADLQLIEKASGGGLTFEETMTVGKAREAVGKQIEHELRLWTRRGYTINDLFEE